MFQDVLDWLLEFVSDFFMTMMTSSIIVLAVGAVMWPAITGLMEQQIAVEQFLLVIVLLSVMLTFMQILVQALYYELGGKNEGFFSAGEFQYRRVQVRTREGESVNGFVIGRVPLTKRVWVQLDHPVEVKNGFLLRTVVPLREVNFLAWDKA